MDDKGQVQMNLKGVEAHLKATGSLPVNVKFLIEGEEEVGSGNLDNFIAAHQELLQADVVLISDSPMFDRGIPSICYGLRGLVYMQIDLKGSASDLHSGSFGGAVINPNFAVCTNHFAAEKQHWKNTNPWFLRRCSSLKRRGERGAPAIAF